MKKFDFSKLGRLGVLYGGSSAERTISIESGEAIVDACRRLGIDVVPVLLNQTLVIETLQSVDIDAAFIALHGGIGEDGRLQSLLNFMRIPHTGSDTQSSMVAMDKVMSKRIWRGMNLNTPNFIVLGKVFDAEDVLRQLGGEAIVKPSHEGSSIGMTVATNSKELMAAHELASRYDFSVFAEKLIRGPEYTVAFLDGETLPPIKLETDHLFYDYDAKYHADDTRYLCPCGLSKNDEMKLKEVALQAFTSLQCSGWGRVDLMLDHNGDFSILEVNTVPGMTSHSLVPMAAKAAGYSFDELIARILSAVKPVN
ncbi:MAG: D-alanine-D-alanine ligase [Cellvibrionaceae bacterium]|jgi:D-alanine-D-alanine ligase